MYRVFMHTSDEGLKFSTNEHTITKETKCFYEISRGGNTRPFKVSKDDYESHDLYVAESAEEAVEVCLRKMLETSIRIIDNETTMLNNIQKYLKENYK